jgi:(E)-4-hydroxy-3-methylbut-2-enyl-diphosphate synthase
LAEAVEKHIQTMRRPLKVAVMGCPVNGPGEAKEADIGLAGGQGSGIIFKKGEVIRRVPEERLLSEFLAELDAMEREGELKEKLARARAVRAELVDKLFNADDIDTLKKLGQP